MDGMSLLLLSVSIVLFSGRNIFTKKISDVPFGKRRFFFLQAIIFLSGTALLLVLSGKGLLELTPLTFGYALIYGSLLISAQWCYTIALKKGDTAICATVYALGFVFPTLSGTIFWQERMTLCKALGILVVIPTIILAGKKDKKSEKKQDQASFILFLILAMVSAGGMGIMQKVQQKSPYPDQRTVFMLIAFAFAGLTSLLCGLLTKEKTEKHTREKEASACGIGLCFASCNLLNTTLAGRLDSAVFYPLLNVGVILMSLVLSIVFFKEKLSKRHFWILLLGITSILLINA